jgi:hypothetical protein
MTLDTFEHDFQRWIAWVEDGSIGGLRLDEEGKAAARLEVATDAGARMVGNPVQHRDHGVSVLLLADRSGGPALTAHRFDPTGKAQGSRGIATYGTEPRPITASTDWNGRIYAVSGTAGRLPVELHVAAGGGPATRHLLLDPAADEGIGARLADAEVLALRADTQLVVAKMRAVVALLRSGEGPDQRLVFTRTPLADDGSPAADTTVVEVGFAAGLLQAGEWLAAATVGQGAGQPYGTVTTSKGRLLFVEPGQTPREVVTVPEEAIGLADLLPASGGLFLVHPTDTRGMRHTVVKEPLARP